MLILKTYLDSTAFIIAFTGYLTVFVSLVLLYYAFRMIPKWINWNAKRKLKRQGRHHELKDDDMHLQGEVAAAIAMTLYLYFYEQHDEENMVLTLKRVQRRYSPWSSKIYNVYDLKPLNG